MTLMAVPGTGLIASGTEACAPLVVPFFPPAFASAAGVSTDFGAFFSGVALTVFTAFTAFDLLTLAALAGLALATGCLGFSAFLSERVAGFLEGLDFDLGCRLGLEERLGGFETAFLVGLGIPELECAFAPTYPIAASVRAAGEKAQQRLRGDLSNQGLLSAAWWRLPREAPVASFGPYRPRFCEESGAFRA